MSLNKTEFSQCIQEFKFRKLFNEMGWTNDRTSQPIIVDGETFKLEAAAEKSGFKVLVCSPTSEGIIPDYNTRKKIETKVTKLFQEHLIIFQDARNSEQIWQFVVRQTGKPTKVTETRYNVNQDPELLFQRASGIFFELDEEENITIVDVTKRIAENFHQNADKVTAKFYIQFKKEHASFYDFLNGIDDHIDEWNKTHPKDKKENLSKQWYVSLMLNRLMFCYFIQKKGFLDSQKNGIFDNHKNRILDRKKDYLRIKLRESQAKKGKDKFYSFYRHFLLELFHRGLGAPDHSDGLRAEIGRIPYLNGGLFDEHELEKKFDKIQIDDAAFERIFDFFDQYEWHLDTRAKATGKDINPDVIGYIFEKYINDRAQMGAYYTKEDITDYISKNCILPFLFDETKRNYPKAFTSGSEIWEMLKSSGDQYIYDAVKFGVDKELPAEIAVGLDTSELNLLERRKGWNKPAASTHALPTEIWRETVDRRRRYAEVKAKIENGEIETVNDFITYNLNITQFVQDAIENTNDPDFLKAFYRALNSVTIIDPTCGSGAFLFAAMNILEPLYESSLQRMRNFIEDEDRRNIDDKKTFKNKFPEFRKILEDVQNPAHPNLQYFVYKSIILRNLYGVDIMNEAVEIAKLRLFLKLVATVEANYSKPNLGLEPLPDIDFNIRAGNTLIGFANEVDLDNSLRSTVEGFIAKPRITEEMEKVAMAFNRYKDIQLSYGNDFNDFKEAKNDLNERLKELNEELSGLLHKQNSSLDYDKWQATHQPFHWFAEFYEIIHDKGGFDVIIGNPPYVEYAKVINDYKIQDYETITCGNLYAFVSERAIKISTKKARIGFIVPISLTAAQRMEPLQDVLIDNSSSIYFSNYALRPAALFPGVMQRLTIFLIYRGQEGNIFTSDYRTWYSDERDTLFDLLRYQNLQNIRQEYSIPKIDNTIAHKALVRMLDQGKHWYSHKQFKGSNVLYYHNAGGYWVKTFDFRPYYRSLTNAGKKHTTISELFMPDEVLITTYLALLNSSIFYFFWKSLTDARHIYPSDIANLPIKLPLSKNSISKLREILNTLMTELKENSTRIVYGSAEVDQFFVSPSKPIIDEIDRVLAEHYGFTEEELDFIINYDIKYRMGKELGGDNDEESIQSHLAFS